MGLSLQQCVAPAIPSQFAVCVFPAPLPQAGEFANRLGPRHAWYSPLKAPERLSGKGHSIRNAI